MGPWPMHYAESELLPLSALQHLLFCPRQCALIHLEQVWAENLFTAEGRVLHEKTHTPGSERKRSVRVEYSLPLRSLRMGLTGKADVVEFHSEVGSAGENPYPVEYKRGKPKTDDSDLVQLCAQALCLEEMLDVRVLEGALFYGRERRRTRVEFDEALRRKTEQTALELHSLVAAGRTPPPEYSARCKSCSLQDACLPKACSRRKSVSSYLAAALEEM